MAKSAASSYLQKRITVNSAVCGTIIALMIVVFDAAGMLQPFEWWLYDVRARSCQFFTSPPSNQIVHLSIDDEAINAIGPWPWRRSTIAALLDEIGLAAPKVTGIDVIFDEPQGTTIRKNLYDAYEAIDEDAAMAESIRRLGSVVLPTSLVITADEEQASALKLAGTKELERDPSITASELAHRLGQQNFTGEDVATKIAIDFPDLLRDALHHLIRARLRSKAMSLDELRSDLAQLSRPAAAAAVATAPSTAASASTQPVSSSMAGLDALIAKLYQRVLGELGAEHFSLPAPKSLRALPPEASVYLTPLYSFSRAAAGCGFPEYAIFKEPTVRAVPLFVRDGDRFYPQFAFAIAARMYGVDPASVQIEDDFVTIPATSGPVRIPVRSRYSAAVNRDIGLLMDIPWFGTTDWRTMYDWPQHLKVERNYSINIVWDIVDARAKIDRNNFRMDKAMKFALIAPERVAEYEARQIPGSDYSTRRKLALQTLQDLKDDGWEDLFRSKSEAELTVQELNIRDASSALRALIAENGVLGDRIERKRKELAGLIGGKAVLIGWIATGTLDQVTTSIHSRCPGVVVHGVIVNAILQKNFLKTAPLWVPILLTLLFGLLTTALTSRMEPIRVVPILLAIGGAYFAINGILLFSKLHLIVDAAAPLVAMCVCWGGCMVVRLVIEGLERIKREREAAIIDHEIALARQVQANLIPKKLSILSKVESHGWTLAATTTGGDCFDLWKLADGRLGILVADASGHGLGPSIIVSEVRALVRALCDLYTEPQKLLERVNLRIAEDLQATKFCTAFVGFLSEDGKLTWGSAGHGPMLFAADASGEVKELEGTGLPLGVSEEWFGDPEVPVLELKHGGWLAVISDGIFEQPDPAGEQFGVDRVKQAIMSCNNATSEKVVECLRDTVFSWQVVKEANDDQTIVFIRLADQPTGQPDQPPADPPAAPASAEVATTAPE